MSKSRAAIIVLVLGLATACGLAYRSSMRAAAAATVAHVTQRVDEVQLLPEERLWEKIGWAPSFVAAIEASRTSGRPVLFVAMDGHLDGLC